MKTINYLGVNFKVQDEVRFVATDSNGNVCAFTDFPIPIKDSWETMKSDGKRTFLVRVRADSDWLNSIKGV